MKREKNKSFQRKTTIFTHRLANFKHYCYHKHAKNNWFLGKIAVDNFNFGYVNIEKIKV